MVAETIKAAIIGETTAMISKGSKEEATTAAEAEIAEVDLKNRVVVVTNAEEVLARIFPTKTTTITNLAA